jgi:hypothetical protein
MFICFLDGIGVESWLLTMSMMIHNNFGLISYSTIFGMVTTAQYVGVATNPLLAGYMYDNNGTYQ